MMKAISLWQPWATLVGLGVKTIETRSWATKYRGPLAIHAAKRQPEHGLSFPDGWWAWNDRSTRHRATPYIYDPRQPTPQASVTPLPLGAVVATCELVDCVPIMPVERFPGDVWPTDAWPKHVTASPQLAPDVLLWDEVALSERLENHHVRRILGQQPYGDFTPGRYAWLLDNIKPLPEPVPAKGRPGLWEWDACTRHGNDLEEVCRG